MTHSPLRQTGVGAAPRVRTGMKRGMLTSVTVGGLFGVYCLYAAVVGPLTRPHVLPDEIRGPAAAPEIKPLSIAGKIAGQHLADHDWVSTAKYQLQRGEETFIYFHSQRQIGDDRQNKMRVSPFAMVWKDPKSKSGAAYTLSCESAVIEFDSKVQLGMTGRIIGGQLDGAVRVTGPDGLEIRGQNFLFEEKALRLHSDNPIQFRYGPRPGHFEQVQGRAERIDVTLEDATESVLGHDMPRVGGLRQIALGRNVGLNLVMDDGGRPAPVQVLCKTRLIYDVKQMIATFIDDVRVRRLTSREGMPEQFDWLSCDHMQLMFREAQGTAPQLAAVEAPQGNIVQASASVSRQRREDALGISLDLEFERLSAMGPDLKVGSEENNLTARMEQLFYDAIERTIEMRHSTGDVEARFRSDILNCPTIRLWHTDDDQIESALCQGPGNIVRHDDQTNDVLVEASWEESLSLNPDRELGVDVLEIAGDGRVVQPLQKTGIVADTLRVWLDGEAIQAADGDLEASLVNADGAGGLPLKRVHAATDVALVSPRMHLETQSLDVTFVAGQVLTPESESATSEQAGGSGEDEDQEQPVVVAADAVTAQLIVDPATRQTDILQLNAADGITISRAAGEATGERSSEDPFAIEAAELELRNRDGSHVLRLLGTPARIRHPEAEIEGNELYFDRAGNLAMVEGAGALFVWVNSDLEGEPLEVPEKLLVRWSEQMKFDGQQADFLGQVRATLEDSKMLCERMTISLDRRLQFSEAGPRTQDLQISRIDCREGVEGEYTEWQRDPVRMIAMRKIQVASFAFDVRSGEIHAQGPGRIDDWQLAGQRRRLRLDPAAAVTPAAAEVEVEGGPRWEYTRINFAGEMTGNQNDRYVTLHDRVRVMHGPVERALAVIDRDEFSQETPQAKNSIWIGADTLQVRLVPGEMDAPDTATVLAKGNAELQGKVMGARADSISYDEANEMFTLKGLGSEAYLWHQEQPGSPTRETLARTIQFVPSRYEITVDGVRGIQGSQ